MSEFREVHSNDISTNEVTANVRMSNDTLLRPLAKTIDQDRYVFVRKLADGGFGRIYQVWDHTQQAE